MEGIKGIGIVKYDNVNNDIIKYANDATSAAHDPTKENPSSSKYHNHIRFEGSNTYAHVLPRPQVGQIRVFY